MSEVGFSRRGFLGVAAAGAVVGACSGAQTQRQDATGSTSSGDPTTGPAAGQYRESPMLAAQVKAGALPPVTERLPKKPYVVQPGILVDDTNLNMQPGNYGGTLELDQGGGGIGPGLTETVLWAPNGFNSEEGAIVGNVVEGYEVNDDEAVFTFHLREGLRWSDGEPVTIEDVRFTFDDVLNNSQITPVFPDRFRAAKRNDAAPAKFKVLDDWAFSLTFDAPYGGFPGQLAMYWEYKDVFKPRHYLEAFHPKYASKAGLQKVLKEASIPADQWFNLFNIKQSPGLFNLDAAAFIALPVLTPWIMTQARDGVCRFERNAYYFKVDSDGNQLPYVDSLRTQVTSDPEVRLSRALFGEFDYLSGASLSKVSLVTERADAGELTLSVERNTFEPFCYLNLTYPDATWRTVAGDVRFRHALDLAINREEIIDNFYLGEFASVPTKTGPGVYDSAAAISQLDEMGMSQKDEAGYRLGPDGKRFTVPLEVVSQGQGDDLVPMCELIAEHWKKIGVHATVRSVGLAVGFERMVNNQLKASGGIMGTPELWASGMHGNEYLPIFWWGPLWMLWYTTRGKQGLEPPSEVKQLFEFHNQSMAATIGSDEHKAAVEGIVRSHRENFWMLKIVEGSSAPAFWKKRVKNVPQGPVDQAYGLIVQASMEQWYIDE